MKIEISAENMNDAGAKTVLNEIRTLVAGYITGKGLRRMVKIKGGK